MIAKVLCAWPLREPVDSAIVLQADELDEADGLLIAAIQRWEKLKSTTPAALRETFLQRNGKLYYKNDSLRLQVESAGAIDILLDHLPWNLSLLKLPWMKDILRVDWR